jgi:two-component system, OmpR family, sensor histidine kinase ArlS
LHSAIKNVVINACKYSDDKAAKVYLHFNSDNINIVVADNGPGINQEELGLIFQPFYRSNNAIQKQGFGLGLSLALRIIKLHKGDIHIKSANNYTVCNITLPLANPLTGA